MTCTIKVKSEGNKIFWRSFCEKKTFLCSTYIWVKCPCGDRDHAININKWGCHSNNLILRVSSPMNLTECRNRLIHRETNEGCRGNWKLYFESHSEAGRSIIHEVSWMNWFTEEVSWEEWFITRWTMFWPNWGRYPPTWYPHMPCPVHRQEVAYRWVAYSMIFHKIHNHTLGKNLQKIVYL